MKNLVYSILTVFAVVSMTALVSCEKDSLTYEELATMDTTSITDPIDPVDTVVTPVDTTPALPPYPYKEWGFFLPIPDQSNLKSTNSVEVDSLSFNPVPENLKTGMVAYFPFNDSIIDEGPNHLNSKLLGVNLEENVIFNDTTNNTGSLIQVDDDRLNFDETFSISVWYDYNPDILVNRGQGLIGKRDVAGSTGYSIQLVNPTLYNTPEGFYSPEDYPQLVFGVNGYNCNFKASDAVKAGISFPNSGWHHIVCTFNKGTLKMYIDGVCRKTVTDGNHPAFIPLSDPLWIGRDGNTDLAGEKSPRYFYGALDQVIMYNKTLTSTEVSELYNLRIK